MTNDQRGHGNNELQGSQPSIIYTCVSYQVSAVELGKDCFGGWMVDRSRVGRLLVSRDPSGGGMVDIDSWLAAGIPRSLLAAA